MSAHLQKGITATWFFVPGLFQHYLLPGRDSLNLKPAEVVSRDIGLLVLLKKVRRALCHGPDKRNGRVSRDRHPKPAPNAGTFSISSLLHDALTGITDARRSYHWTALPPNAFAQHLGRSRKYKKDFSISGVITLREAQRIDFL